MSAPRTLTWRTWASTSSGTSKLLAGSSPNSIFVAATSSAPSADPWDFAVFRAVGAGHAIIVLSRINVGLFRSFIASLIALSSATRSTSPFDNAATSITFQPYAR